MISLVCKRGFEDLFFIKYIFRRQIHLSYNKSYVAKKIIVLDCLIKSKKIYLSSDVSIEYNFYVKNGFEREHRRNPPKLPIYIFNKANLSLDPRQLKSNSKRVGAITIKCGITQFWNKLGRAFPVSILWLDENIVSQIKIYFVDGMNSLQVGASIIRQSEVCGKLKGHYRYIDT